MSETSASSRHDYRSHSGLLTCVALLLFTLVYFWRSILLAKTTALDVDEVFITWIVRFFPAGKVFDALKMGLDSKAPGYYWLLDGFATVFGQTTLALRLPSILGFYVFALSVFQVLRKFVEWQIAVCAVFFTCLTGAAYASTLIQPYALVLGCFGVAAAGWVDFPSSRHRRLCGLLTVLALAIALSVHFLAIYLVVALGIAELIRSWCDRKIQWGYWLCLAASSATLLLWLPVIAPIFRMTHSSIKAPGFYAPPTVWRLFGLFMGLLRGNDFEQVDLILALLLIPLMLVAARSGWSWLAAPFSVPSTGREADLRDLDILTFAALALPFITFAFSVLVTGSFNMRYFLAAVLGLILLAARGLHALRDGVQLAGLLLALTVGWVAIGWANDMVMPVYDPRIALIRHAPEQLPVVLPSATDFFSLSEAAPPDLRSHIAFVGMPGGLSSPDPEPELLARNWKAAIPSLAVYTGDQWFEKTKVFYVLYTSDPREGLTDWLLAHAQTQIIAHAGSIWLLRVDVSNMNLR